jgi:hypothetical protein
MALSSGALTTVAKLRRYLGVGVEDSTVSLPALDVYNDESVGSAATVEVKAATMVLTVTGGATTTLTFADADTDTMGECVTKINAIAGGDWFATLQGDTAASTTLLNTIPPTSAFGVANEQSLFYAGEDILEHAINAASAQIVAWLDREFATQDFSEIGTFNRNNGIIQLRHPYVTEIDFFAIELHDALTVYFNTAGSIGTVEVRDDSVVLRSGASDTATETEKTLTDATDDTIGELATTITAVGGWTASSLEEGPAQYLDRRPAIATKPKAPGSDYAQVTLEAWTPYDGDYTIHFEEGILEVPFAFAAFHGYGPIRYRCDYTAGYSTIPPDVEQVCIELASEMFQQTQVDYNLKKERLGDYSYEVADSRTIAANRRDKYLDRLHAHRKVVI